MFSRALGALAFWRPRSDTVSCSVLAPPALSPGEAATLPLFAHSEPADTIRAIGRTYFPTHELVATTTIRRELVRGARVTFHIALPGLSLEPPSHKFVWRGQVMPLPFTVAVPPDFRPGEVVGVVSIADGADVVCNCEFPVVIQPNG